MTQTNVKATHVSYVGPLGYMVIPVKDEDTPSTTKAGDKKQGEPGGQGVEAAQQPLGEIPIRDMIPLSGVSSRCDQ